MTLNLTAKNLCNNDTQAPNLSKVVVLSSSWRYSFSKARFPCRAACRSSVDELPAVCRTRS